MLDRDGVLIGPEVVEAAVMLDLLLRPVAADAMLRSAARGDDDSERRAREVRAGALALLDELSA